MNVENNLHKILTPGRIFGFALLLMIPMVFLEQIPERDIAGRYAPMAEALVRGDWAYAFHPRIPMLHPVLAGIVAWITGCAGFTACKIVSALFYALSVFPAYILFKRLFGRETALLGALLTVLCSHLIRLGYFGLRESIKEFAILLAVCALILVYQNREKLSGYFLGALACMMLITSRGDIVLYAILILLMFLFIDLRRNRRWHLPWRSVGAGILTLMLISPTLIYGYRTIGYPVPEARIGIVMSKVLPFLYNPHASVKLPGHEGPSDRTPPFEIASILTASPNTVMPKTPSTEPTIISSNVPFGVNREMAFAFASSVFDGFYPLFGIPALAIIILRIRKGQWKKEESIVLGALLVHTLIVTVQIMLFDHYLYVSTRYLTPAAPLLFGWSALFLIGAVQELRERFPRHVTPVRIGVVASVMALLLLADGWGSLLKDFTSPEKSHKRQASRIIAAWLKNDFTNGRQYVPRQISWESYLVNKAPVVYCDNLHVVGSMANGQDFDILHPLSPDYVILRAAPGESSAGLTVKDGRLVKEFDIQGTIYRIFRRNNP